MTNQTQTGSVVSLASCASCPSIPVDETPFRNCSLAFKTAEEHLEIPAFLDVEDVVMHKNPDKFSIMTYVVQFYHKFESEEEGEV